MEHLRKLVELFQEKNPGLRAREELFQHIEDTLLPHLLRVIQRDNTLMTEIELFPGIKVEWEGNDDSWKRLHMALIYSVLHGNPKEKFGKIMEAVKGVMPGGSAQADEIQKLLENEETQNSMSEMLELIMNTRLVSLVGEVVQSLEFADLNLNLEDPAQLLNMLQNPQENETLKEIMDRARMILEEKIKSGKIDQEGLRRDIENIRAKFQSSFGKYMNQAVLGEDAGNTTGNTTQQILSNHPDARRARMLARLQKKQQQKTRDSK
jgi:predicted RNA binding protein with dsRBD fold (UPF0201 family)